MFTHFWRVIIIFLGLNQFNSLIVDFLEGLLCFRSFIWCIATVCRSLWVLLWIRGLMMLTPPAYKACTTLIITSSLTHKQQIPPPDTITFMQTRSLSAHFTRGVEGGGGGTGVQQSNNTLPTTTAPSDKTPSTRTTHARARTPRWISHAGREHRGKIRRGRMG